MDSRSCSHFPRNSNFGGRFELFYLTGKSEFPVILFFLRQIKRYNFPRRLLSIFYMPIIHWHPLLCVLPMYKFKGTQTNNFTLSLYLELHAWSTMSFRLLSLCKPWEWTAFKLVLQMFWQLVSGQRYLRPRWLLVWKEHFLERVKLQFIV